MDRAAPRIDEQQLAGEAARQQVGSEHLTDGTGSVACADERDSPRREQGFEISGCHGSTLPTPAFTALIGRKPDPVDLDHGARGDRGPDWLAGGASAQHCRAVAAAATLSSWPVGPFAGHVHGLARRSRRRRRLAAERRGARGHRAGFGARRHGLQSERRGARRARSGLRAHRDRGEDLSVPDRLQLDDRAGLS